MDLSTFCADANLLDGANGQYLLKQEERASPTVQIYRAKLEKKYHAKYRKNHRKYAKQEDELKDLRKYGDIGEHNWRPSDTCMKRNLVPLEYSTTQLPRFFFHSHALAHTLPLPTTTYKLSSRSLSAYVKGQQAIAQAVRQKLAPSVLDTLYDRDAQQYAASHPALMVGMDEQLTTASDSFDALLMLFQQKHPKFQHAVDDALQQLEQGQGQGLKEKTTPTTKLGVSPVLADGMMKLLQAQQLEDKEYPGAEKLTKAFEAMYKKRRKSEKWFKEIASEMKPSS